MKPSRSRPRPAWPGGHRFAFSIFDDTDSMTLENGRPVYELLSRLGIPVTKSVWPLAPDPGRGGTVGGTSCADAAYLAWVRDLQAAGHEIGYHHASDHSSTRARTREGLDTFASMFGHDPRVGADHAANRESLAAGSGRLSGSRRRAYAVAERLLQPARPAFEGADPSSAWFWGDLCRERITYWRGLTFRRAELLDVCPALPYHDPRRPYVNNWFVSADTPRLAHVLDRIAPARLDHLERSGGVCILYTHLGVDAVDEGRVDRRLVRALTDLAARDCWFAPVSTVLDHLAGDRPRLIGDRERARMETRWIVDRIRSGSPLGPRVVTHALDASTGEVAR